MTELRTGTCKFCGQGCQVEVPKGMPQEFVDDAVIDVCTCREAVHESERRKKLKFAYEYIENLFEDEAKCDFFKASIRSIEENVIEKVKILDNEWTYEIKMDSDGMIHINRTKNLREENTF